MLQEVWAPDVREAYIISGLGSGKSTIGAVFLAYALYWLHNLKMPQRYYNLRPTSKLVVLNVATSAPQA
ncbi:unnamed protein product, partial [marine sediment metagenome]